MRISFSKYHGTGNDFVLVDETEHVHHLTTQQIEHLCSRRFGVGADGLILIRQCENANFEMVYHNADGKVGSMCGNGGRCAVKFSVDQGLVQDKGSFLAFDGIHHYEVDSQGVVTISMSNVSQIQMANGDFFCNTGSPHVVKFVKELKNLNVAHEGSSIRNNAYWTEREGTNVNFVEVAEHKLIVRTFERGVEAETYSCGTGVTAAALVAHEEYGLQSPIQIDTLGGQLKVYFEKVNQAGFEELRLQGPAIKVFQGEANF